MNPKATDQPSSREWTFWLSLYALLLPTVAGMILFSYVPKLDALIMAFYRWQPPTVQEYIGWKHFYDAFSDSLFWQSFQLTGILLIANFFKLWPGIFAAVALHRLASPRVRYWYQVAFVVPMIIPVMVWLLIWKSFYHPDFGLLNRLLNLTGIMELLSLLDGTASAPGIMPTLAWVFDPVIHRVIDPVFGSVWGMALTGGAILALAFVHETPRVRHSKAILLLLGALMVPTGISLLGSLGWLGAALTTALFAILFYYLSLYAGGRWVLWALLLFASVVIFWNEWMRVPLLFLFVVSLAELARLRLFPIEAESLLKRIGLGLLITTGLLVCLGMIWTRPTGQFADGNPAWLGNQQLVIPALIFWGFPWVSAVGVLIYLAGLQQIDPEIYEAAELDGASWFGKFIYIELPLILTQIRINLIFITVSTLTGYEMFLILLGPDGGPGNVGMVPGLYMFKTAFDDGHFGYACALGLILFVLILLLTVIYNRYVKVEK